MGLNTSSVPCNVSVSTASVKGSRGGYIMVLWGTRKQRHDEINWKEFVRNLPLSTCLSLPRKALDKKKSFRNSSQISNLVSSS